MTRDTRQPELSDVEPPLPELSRLRELSRLDVPPKHVASAVWGRLQQTTHASAPVGRRHFAVRPWALAFGVFVTVPSVFAATPLGSAVVQRTIEWATRTFVFSDTTSAIPQEQNRAAAGPGVKQTVGAREQAASTSALFRVRPQVNEGPPPGATFGPIELPLAEARKPPGEGIRAQPPSALQSGGAVATRAPVANGGNSVATFDRANTNSTLNAERQLLERARVRLGAGDVKGALELTTRHEALFPRGILTEERQAIMNQARGLEARRP
jgi:hypothetical protein